MLEQLGRNETSAPKLEKLKILVPLDKSDIRGSAGHDASQPRYKPVFEEAVRLAECLNAEMILLHVLDRREEETILQDDRPESDRFYHTTDLRDLNMTGEIRYLPLGQGEKLTEWEFKSWIAWNAPLDYSYQERLQFLVAKARDEGIPAKAMNMIDSRSLIICEAAAAWDADLIIMGRGRGAELRCLALDSVSTYVLHHAPCSIVLVDPQTREIANLRNILVGVDFSASSQEIFRQALSLAVRLRSAAIALNPEITPESATPTLTLLHVRSFFEQYDYPEMRGTVSLSWDFDIAHDQSLEAAARPLDAATRIEQNWVRSLKSQAEEHHIPVKFLEYMAEDSQPQGVSRFLPQPGALAGSTLCRVAEAQGADLIVLGYRREWELKKLLLGSVCNYVTHHSTSPVMIVRNFKPRLVEGVTLLAQQQSARPKAAPSK